MDNKAFAAGAISLLLLFVALGVVNTICSLVGIPSMVCSVIAFVGGYVGFAPLARLVYSKLS